LAGRPVSSASWFAMASRSSPGATKRSTMPHSATSATTIASARNQRLRSQPRRAGAAGGGDSTAGSPSPAGDAGAPAGTGLSSGGSANGEPLDPERGLADADRHALAVLAADAHAGVHAHVVADHGDAGQRVGSVADDGG